MADENGQRLAVQLATPMTTKKLVQLNLEFTIYQLNEEQCFDNEAKMNESGLKKRVEGKGYKSWIDKAVVGAR